MAANIQKVTETDPSLKQVLLQKNAESIKTYGKISQTKMTEVELTLYDLVEAGYHKHVDRQAVLYDNGQHQSGISYSQLWDISSKVKKMLSGRENEVIGLCLQIDHRMPAILLGILGCNAAFYNFDVRGFTYAVHVLEEVGAQVILVHQKFVQVIQDHINVDGCISTSVIAPELEDYMLMTLPSVTRRKHSEGLAYCITTSGTTGKPKVVMVPHQCIVPNIIHLRKLFLLISADLVLAATALTFDPSIVEIFMTLSAGACLLIVPPAVRMMPDLLLDVIHERNKVTVIQITPTLLSRFNANRLSQTVLGDNSVMRVIALGGEKFPSCTWLHSMMSPSNRTKFCNLYGTTEVSCWATCYQVTEEDLRNRTEIPLGKPLQNTEVEVHDDGGNIVAEGVGQLWIGGRRRQCVLDVSEDFQFDRRVLRDTGDIVQIKENGKLYYIGRRDEQKKRNGQRIDLEEIKIVGRRNKSVHDIEVMLIHDQLVVFVVLLGDTMVTEVKGIDVYMKEHLPSHWWPDSVLLISKLPITEHGKVDFKSLEQTYQERQDSSCQTDAAGYLMAKWKELTNLCSNTYIQESENFILAGGDSIKAVQLANVVENHLNLHLPLLVDKILHKTYSDVRQYLTNAFEDCAKQLSNMSKDSVADIRVISDKTTDGSGDMNEIKSKKLAASGTVVDFTGINKTTFSKRKISEDQIGKKVTKYMNDFQFSVRRCNRIITYGTENAQKKIESFEKKPDRKVCYSEVNDSSKFQGNCYLSMEEVWKYDTGKCVDASPLVAVKSGGEYLVMIGSHSHRFIAIKGSNGEKLWEKTLPDRIESSACLSACGNFVVVGCYDGNVYILYVDNGEIWWQFETGSQVKCSPVVDTQTGLAYIGSHNETVFCFNVSVREVVWHRNLESGSIFSSPVISCDPHQLCIATLGGEMFALDPSNGKILWEYKFQKPVFSSPAITKLGVLVGCTDKYLYQLSYNGELLWKFPTGGHIFSCSSVFRVNESTEDTTHLPSESKIDEAKCLTAGCRASGTDYLVINSKGTDTGNVREYITIGSHDDCLYCISSIGEHVWKLQVDSEVYSSPFQCYINVNSSDIKSELKGPVIEMQFGNPKVSVNSAEIGKNLSESVSHIGCYRTVSEKRHVGDITETNMKCQCSNCRAISQDFNKQDTKDECITERRHVVVFASTVGTLYIVHVPTGKILCTKHLDGEIFSSPVVYKNIVVVGCRNDFVYCFKIS